MQDRIHVYPVDRKTKRSDHITKKHGSCWCNPEILQVCSESDESSKCRDGCWRCGGRSLAEPYSHDLNILVIHTDSNSVA